MHANRFAFGFTDVVPVDIDPVAAVYAAEFQIVVAEFALSNLRWSRLGLTLRSPENPFVRTVADYRAGAVTEYDGSALARHYRGWHPATAADVLGLAADAGAIADQPAQAVTLPWLAEAAERDPARRLDRLERWSLEETRAHGAALGRAHGHKHFGPVSDQFARLEFGRYTALADSVARRGFVTKPAHDTHIGVHVLVDGARRVGLNTGPGLHRAVVAAAFGVDPLVVAVEKPPLLVHRSDVAAWPGVRNGLFTEHAALALFDRIVDGSPPAGLPADAPE